MCVNTCVNSPRCSDSCRPLSPLTTRSSSMSHLFPTSSTWALSHEYVLIWVDLGTSTAGSQTQRPSSMSPPVVIIPFPYFNWLERKKVDVWNQLPAQFQTLVQIHSHFKSEFDTNTFYLGVITFTYSHTLQFWVFLFRVTSHSLWVILYFYLH